MRVSLIFFFFSLGWPRTLILSILASQVARITDMSHQCPTHKMVFVHMLPFLQIYCSLDIIPQCLPLYILIFLSVCSYLKQFALYLTTFRLCSHKESSTYYSTEKVNLSKEICPTMTEMQFITVLTNGRFLIYIQGNVLDSLKIENVITSS
jgi:hypothetical protein